MGYVIGIDVGGTFTDCVVVSDQGRQYSDKAFTTSDDLAQGVLQALRNVGQQVGLSLEPLLESTSIVSHGTTAFINRLVTRSGATTGLITTKGHEDAILIGRVRQKVDGLSEQEILDAARMNKPEPIVPRTLIKGVTERIDYKGAVIVALNEGEVRAAAESLVAEGAQAIAICYLWSFLNPAHEQRSKQLVRQAFPNIWVTASHEIAPALGEYERTATTVLNAYLGPTAAEYFEHLETLLRHHGFGGSFFAMQNLGGVISAQEASDKAVFMLSSGPVAGVIGGLHVAQHLGHSRVITADMGGTSFDVGLVVDGQPPSAKTPIYERYRVLVPAVDIISIGAGGGTIAWLDPAGILRVGPRSAGSFPGPVCYGHGGTQPTVTDADLVLGRINPQNFFGGRVRLDCDGAAESILQTVAKPLGLSLEQAAKGIVDIVDAHMADLVRRVTIERGNDPRDFVLYAYGGGAPLHVGAFGPDVGVSKAVVPAFASVFSAWGIARADLLRAYVRSQPMRTPFDPELLTAIFATLERRAVDDFISAAVDPAAIELSRSVDMKYRYQVHEIAVPISRGSLNSANIDRLVEDFEQIYERTYGQGTAYRRAGVEIAALRLHARVRLPSSPVAPLSVDGSDASGALAGHRSVYFDSLMARTPVYDLAKLKPGNHIAGPAVVEGATTSILVHPSQWVEMHPHGHVVMSLSPTQ